MSTITVPALFVGLVDDAAVFPPGSAPLAEAVTAHRQHRAAWYASMIGPLLLPVDGLPAVQPLLEIGERLTVGVIGELRSIDDLAAPVGVDIRQIEMPVAKRGEDPIPGLSCLLGLAAALPGVDVYAEIPLTWGLTAALDALAAASAAGARVAPKFRTGGLAAELFPTPVELAAVICACRDRGLRFKLTAGLHRAIRHNDPETGFVHHGFLNILAASIAAAGGEEVATIADHLASTEPVPLIESVRSSRAEQRPLWTGFGSCSVAEPLGDLRSLGLIAGEEAS